jgi:hypothetical protein
MTARAERDIFYFLYASCPTSQLSLLTGPYFAKPYAFEPVGASGDTVGADDHDRETVIKLHYLDILQMVRPTEVLAKIASLITDAIRQDMHHREFLDL